MPLDSVGIKQTGWIWRGPAWISHPPAASQACRVQVTSLNGLCTPLTVLWGPCAGSCSKSVCWQPLKPQRIHVVNARRRPQPNSRQQAHKQESHAAHLEDGMKSPTQNGCRHTGPAGGGQGGAAGLNAKNDPGCMRGGAGPFFLSKREGPQQTGVRLGCCAVERSAEIQSDLSGLSVGSLAKEG